MQRTKKVTGFTLVELLVVISVIALLISILLPSLKKSRDQAKAVVCRSSLKGLGLATIYYADEGEGRLPWILGSPNPAYSGNDPPNKLYSKAPFHQYEQIFLLWNYVKELKTFNCPMASSPGKDGLVADNGAKLSPFGPKSVKREYVQGTDISYHSTLNASDRFLQAYQRRQFPTIVDPFSTDRNNENGEGLIEELTTEFWFNDWQEGASVAGKQIPAISGGKINRIPYPNYAVVMTDATWWNPRHNGSNQFLFLDTHVDSIKRDRYFDPEALQNPSSDARDRDAFGNHPFWSWGLGTGVRGY